MEKCALIDRSWERKKRGAGAESGRYSRKNHCFLHICSTLSSDDDA